MQTKEQKGFQVLPKRWVVERTFAWLNGSRRLSKDYETSCCSAETMIMISHAATLLNRLWTQALRHRIARTVAYKRTTISKWNCRAADKDSFQFENAERTSLGGYFTEIEQQRRRIEYRWMKGTNAMFYLTYNYTNARRSRMAIAYVIRYKGAGQAGAIGITIRNTLHRIARNLFGRVGAQSLHQVLHGVHAGFALAISL